MNSPSPVKPDIFTIWSWLDTPLSSNATYELSLLEGHLHSIQGINAPLQEHGLLLDRLFPRCISIVSSLLPTLVGTPLPIHRKTRQLVRSLHKTLEILADELLIATDRATVQISHISAPSLDLLFWRVLYSLSQHLLISELTASPASKGIWQKLHRTFERARNLQLSERKPKDGSQSLQNIYLSTILLGCAQPATFSSNEINFVATYLKTFSDIIDPPTYGNHKIAGTFWIDPERDEPAIACSRKPPPPETSTHILSCARLTALLENQLSALESGKTPQTLGLPELAETPTGRGVLRRLITYWGTPGKRRFPRRRQSYRVALCSGLSSLWHLYMYGINGATETSNWMVTNESPEGYALMHVSGKTGTLSIGDVAAIQTDSGENWQTCIVRWAFSENQEHFELGLQILASQVIPALLAAPNSQTWNTPQPVLILPQIPILRPNELLVAPSGTLENPEETFVLLVEESNLSVREVKSTHLDEQNTQIEVFAIDTLAT